jgi:hypothetical protein
MRVPDGAALHVPVAHEEQAEPHPFCAQQYPSVEQLPDWHCKKLLQAVPFGTSQKSAPGPSAPLVAHLLPETHS